MRNGNISNKHGELLMVDFDSILLSRKPSFLGKLLGERIELKFEGIGLLRRIFKKTDFRIYIVSTVCKNADELKKELNRHSVPYQDVYCSDVDTFRRLYTFSEYDMLLTNNAVFKGEMNVSRAFSSSELLAFL